MSLTLDRDKENSYNVFLKSFLLLGIPFRFGLGSKLITDDSVMYGHKDALTHLLQKPIFLFLVLILPTLRFEYVGIWVRCLCSYILLPFALLSGSCG